MDGNPLTYRIVSNPAHGTLSGAAPNLQYTSASKYVGPDSFTFVANDGSLDSNVATISITVVKEINDPPVADNQSVQTREDEPLRIRLTAEDPDNNNLNFDVVTMPAHGTLTGSGRNLRYSPSANYNGPDTLTFQVFDKMMLASNIATVSITVTPVNDAPVAQDQKVVTDSDKPVAIVLTAQDVEGSPLTYRIVNQPRHGTLSGAAPNLVYTPASRYFGPDSFTFVANDGAADSDVAAVSITVKKVNHAPVARSQSVQTNEDDSLVIDLTADDSDGDALTFEIVSRPAHGTLTGSGRNVRYKPAPDYHGPDSFTFQASDRTLDSNIATVSMMVLPVNDAPEATRINVTTAGGKPVSGLLQATDVDGDALRYRLVTAPRKGTVMIDQMTGRFTYVPDPRRRGKDRFTYVANDGQVDSKPAAVVIDLDGRNDRFDSNDDES